MLLPIQLAPLHKGADHFLMSTDPAAMAEAGGDGPGASRKAGYYLLPHVIMAILPQLFT